MYTPIFQHVPDDWRGRWRLVQTLLERVYDDAAPGNSRKPRMPKSLQAQLAGKPLPPSMLEWMRLAQFLGKRSKRAASDFWHYRMQVEDFPEHGSIALNAYYGCMKWGIAYEDLDQEDPPVSAYAFVQRQNQFVHRKSYGRAPLSHYALHCALNYTPGFGGWSGHSMMGSDLPEPRGFIEELRKTKGALVSEPLGGLTLIEGHHWLAFIVHGYSPFGPQKFLQIRFIEGARFEDIPEAIRTLVEMKPSSLRPSRWAGS